MKFNENAIFCAAQFFSSKNIGHTFMLCKGALFIVYVNQIHLRA